MMANSSNELTCRSCGADNPAGKAFCGDCGNALESKPGVTMQHFEERVKSIVGEQFRDQKAVELETSELVAERAIKWAKIAGLVMSVPVLAVTGILSFFGYKTFSDYEEYVAVVKTANTELTKMQSEFVADASDANTKLTETKSLFVTAAAAANAKLQETQRTVEETHRQAEQAQGRLEEVSGNISTMEIDISSHKDRLDKVEKSRARTTEAIVNATQAAVTSLPFERFDPNPKAGIGRISELIESGATALSFQLNLGGYYGPAIWLYLDNLMRSPSFRFVVILDADRSLFGVYEASTLVAALNPLDARELSQQFPLDSNQMPEERQVTKWTEFALKLREGAKDKIRSYPGFTSAQQSVPLTANKQDVLNSMAKHNVDWLPVVDEIGGDFVGIVDRSQLTASLLLEITSAVRAGQ